MEQTWDSVWTILMSTLVAEIQSQQDDFFMGCPCHLIQNITCKASEAFCDTSKFSLEDMCVDTYYYFDKSTKRKSLLVEFADFLDVEYRQVIKREHTLVKPGNVYVSSIEELFLVQHRE